MKPASVLIIAGLFSATVAITALADNEPVGTTFTYQGRLTQANEPVNEPVDLVFRLYDQPTGGTPLGTLTANEFPLDEDGLLTIDLDFGDVYTGGPRWLEIDVNTVTLAPRQPIMATPHAMIATTVANVPSRAIAGNYTGITGVGTLQSLDVAGNIFATGSNIPIRAIRDAATGTFPGIWGETNSVSSGTSGVRGYSNHTAPGVNAAGVWGHSFSETTNGIGVRGTHETSGTGVRGQSVGGRGVHGHVTDPAGYAGFFTGGRSYFEGRVGIGTESPTTKLDVTGSGEFILGRFHHTGTGNVRALSVRSEGTGYAAEFQILPGANAGAIYAATYGTGSAASFESHQVNENPTVHIFKNNGPALRVRGALGGGTADNTVPVSILGGTNAQLDGGGFLTIGSVASTNVVVDNNEIMARNNGAVSNLHLNKNGGHVIVGTFSGGTGRLVTPVLQITGGSDLSESFDVADLDDLTPQPGMVVCIDPANPGRLLPSTRAYDRTVAGVISGAGGVNSGMIMGQQGSVADGAYPVALTGRVYVMADATAPGSNAIEPGDLLTTSEVPGHAMGVTDYSRMHGAVIGKAMTPLAKGERGLVLVLVNLQ